VFLCGQGEAMDDQWDPSDPTTRAVCGGLGAMMGSVLGVWLLGVLCWAAGYSRADAGLWLASAAAGGVAGAAFGAFAGAWVVKGRAKAVVVGTLAGCVLGLLAAYLCPVIADTVWYRELTWGWGEVDPEHHVRRLLLGLVAGSVFGGLAGLWFSSVGRHEASEDPSGPSGGGRSP
jgi:hypothetical protein